MHHKRLKYFLCHFMVQALFKFLVSFLQKFGISCLWILSDSEPMLPPLEDGGEPTWKVLSTIPPTSIHNKFENSKIKGPKQSKKLANIQDCNKFSFLSRFLNLIIEVSLISVSIFCTYLKIFSNTEFEAI